MSTDENPVDGVWRNEERLPLADLMEAVAMSAGDGQTDDLSGNDAGIEQARQEQRAAGEPDPTSAEGRSLRTDFTGPTGPH